MFHIRLQQAAALCHIEMNHKESTEPLQACGNSGGCECAPCKGPPVAFLEVNGREAAEETQCTQSLCLP